MISIRNAWWATLLLTAFVGCANEEPAGETPAPAAPTTPEATAPAATPAVEKAPEGGTSADLNKSEPPKADAAAPAPAKEEAGELKLNGPAVTPPAVTPPAKEEAGEKKEAAAGPALNAKELAELASLSPADKDLAIKQVVCPVSGENLGSMGAPLKVSAEGKTFLICCDGCNTEVKENGKEVVAKLKN